MRARNGTEVVSQSRAAQQLFGGGREDPLAGSACNRDERLRYVDSASIDVGEGLGANVTRPRELSRRWAEFSSRASADRATADGHGL